MNIELCKQRNAMKLLQQRYAFLQPQRMQSAQDGTIERQFLHSGIWHYDNAAVISFPFHHHGVIDHALLQTQHQQARREMVRRILALPDDSAWIFLSEKAVGFWANVRLSLLQAALADWFTHSDDFPLFIENKYALAIHAAEYEWEVLEKFM